MKGIISNMGLGEEIYNHYVEFFGNPDFRDVYSINDKLPTIQILQWNHVMEGCVVFGTLGVSHYKDNIGNLCEVITVVDAEDVEGISEIIPNALFASAEYEMLIDDYKAYSGLEGLDNNFYDMHKKSGIYFSYPFMFPEEFSMICNEQEHIRFLMAVFITQKEFDYYKNNGAEKLEDLWQSKEVDVFCINRKDVI